MRRTAIKVLGEKQFEAEHPVCGDFKEKIFTSALKRGLLVTQRNELYFQSGGNTEMEKYRAIPEGYMTVGEDVYKRQLHCFSSLYDGNT